MTSKILIVDDRATNLIALDGLLSNDERLLITAQSGKEALEILSREKIDLILLDVQMPDMNGFELAQIIKSKKETAEIPIIFASAEKVDRTSRMKGFEQGAIDYLLKPLDPEITQAKVSALLEAQQQKKQVLEKNALLENCALLINNSADIIGILNADTLAIEEMNPAFTAVLGYAIDEIQTKSLNLFLEQEDAEKLKELARSGEKTHSFETSTYDKGHTKKWLEWKVVVKDGKWYINARDITEIKHLHAMLERNIVQLEAANRELESFSYSVSHDLRAPLRTINGNAQALAEDFGNLLNEEALLFLKKIQDGAIRMDRLINDLLAFSRIGKKEVKKSLIDVELLVRSTFADMSEAQPHQATLIVGQLPMSYGDYSLLQIVWTNLLSNAIKYSSRKSDARIEVGGVEGEEQTEYFVRDNGAGFEMAYAEKLFGTFQRLHDATEFEGVGIGLAIVKRIILKHGGTIRADAAPEKGATFYFTLPVAKDASVHGSSR
jgi:PAS domain S-box-containing protein